MNRRLKIAAAVIFLSALGGCASTVIIEDQSQPLGPDETIILTTITSAAGMLTLSVERVDDTGNAPVAGVAIPIRLNNGDNFLAFRVKKGHKYKVWRYKMQAFNQFVFYFSDPLEFTSMPDRMTYIGDFIFIPQISSGNMTGVRAIVGDNEMETIRQLKYKYPKLFEKYSYQKVIAQ